MHNASLHNGSFHRRHRRKHKRPGSRAVYAKSGEAKLPAQMRLSEEVNQTATRWLMRRLGSQGRVRRRGAAAELGGALGFASCPFPIYSYPTRQRRIRCMLRRTMFFGII
jgi:hypothetical protein